MVVSFVHLDDFKATARISSCYYQRSGRWDDGLELDQQLPIFKTGLEERERAGRATVNGSQPPPPKLNRNDNRKDSRHNLLNGNANGPTCTYCRGNHPSKDYKTVTDVQTRKDLLKKYGRYFVCARKDHISRNCTSKSKCHSCNGKHHISIFQTKLSWML